MKLLLLFLFFRIIVAQSEENLQLYSKEEERLVRDLFENYSTSKLFLPPHNKTNQVLVLFDLSIIHIESLDPVEQTIQLETWNRFRWNDSRLAWNPQHYGGIKTLRLDISNVWRPDISLYNSADTTRDEYTEGSKTKHVVLSNAGGVTWTPAASLTAPCSMDMTHYPFDTHTCGLNFGSWVFDGHHLDLTSEPTIDLSQMLNNTEWKVIFVNATKHTIIYACCPEPYVHVTFSIAFARSSPLYEGAVLFPISAGVILAICAFLISPFTYRRIQFNVILLFLFTFSLFHVFHKFPSVGIRVPALVLVGELFITLTTLSIIWNMIVHALADRFGSSPAPACIQRLLSTWSIILICRTKQETSFQQFQMDDNNSDADTEAIVANGTKTVNNWPTFLIFLDRLAFFFYVIIVVAFLVAFIR